MKRMGYFMYNFFLGGLVFAGVVSFQGALMNVTYDYTLRSNLYLLGIGILMAICVDGIWSTIKERQNMFKLRVIVKAGIISILHFNAYNLFALVIGAEIFFIYLEMKVYERVEWKLWMIENILIDVALASLVYLPFSLLALFLASGLVIAVLVLEFVIMWRDMKSGRVGDTGNVEK